MSEPRSPHPSIDVDPTRTAVRQRYGRIASGVPASSCCGPASAPDPQSGGCCGGGGDPESYAKALGYGDAELALAPEGANLGLGCGNPTALAELRPGEVVVDLGSGAGLDAFIAARRVGPEGRVIGVDMTREMLARARENAVRAGVHDRVEFREGLIEELPVASATADVVISNCVINLSPDKPRVLREAFRVLRPGGRLAVTDIALTAALPPELARLAPLMTACVGGAILAEDYLAAVRDAGFVDITWTRVSAAPLVEDALLDPELAPVLAELGEDRIRAIAADVWSYKISAKHP